MRVVAFIACVLVAPRPTRAQAPDHQHPAGDPPAGAWRWNVNGAAFVGFNYQHRKFTDFDAWESQNWLMAVGDRAWTDWQLRVSTMVSLETFTMRALGSPQVFQTGETFRGAPLIDYQHPHDLVMNLGAELRRKRGASTAFLAFDVVGPATLGPTVFMHRPSAIENPQAPLAHHYTDSTHISSGVLRGGIEAGGWTAEASWFHGREPDENRRDLDLGKLDSFAARLRWTRRAWSAQVSGGHLEEPETITPYDAVWLRASLGYGGEDSRVAWLASLGQNREIHGNLEAYLFEATLRPSARNVFYTRAESVAKDILDVGFHPRGIFHRHRQSQVGAFTAGYVREILRNAAGSFGIGADVTGYAVPPNLRDSYGSPVSFHVFLRYRGGATRHVH